MSNRPYTHFVGVGACYIDTILTLYLINKRVPAYPAEDAKQRASSLSKRRGGNCPNTIEVLQQLLSIGHHSHHRSSSKASDSSDDDDPKPHPPDLFLISTLPSLLSQDIDFIDESFTQPDPTLSSTIRVNTNYSAFRDTPTAASSYIIQSQATNSRTIVNHNALDEMTLAEFQRPLLTITSKYHRRHGHGHAPDEHATDSQPKNAWVHFEGRIPDTTLQCMTWLRETFASSRGRGRGTGTGPVTVTISVECEKPQRDGLQALAEQADVVFYSRSWAEGQGHRSARDCLRSEAERLRGAAQHRDSPSGTVLLCCTWGAEGASCLPVDLDKSGDGSKQPEEIVSRPAWRPESSMMKVVDTVGAGDTWIAGMLFGFLMGKSWDTGDRIEFANELAGRKVLRDGFGGLAVQMRDVILGAREVKRGDEEEIEVIVYD